MNVGFYSFYRLEFSQIYILNIKIKDKLPANNIYIYSENTGKQRINKREALNKIIDDYNQKIIDCIVFENIKALGSDFYMRSKILKILIENNINFIFLEENIVSTSLIKKEKIEMMIFMADTLKEEHDRRSKIGNNIKKYR